MGLVAHSECTFHACPKILIFHITELMSGDSVLKPS